jgi:hypothetical protein
MNKITTTDKVIDGFFGGGWYFILAALLCIPLFIGINSYVNSIGVHKDEAVSFAASVCFMLGVFAGRYMVQVLLTDTATLPKTALAGLMLLIVACTVWLFFHADFPLQGRVSINLMLFWIPFVVISIAMGALVKVIHLVSQNQLKEAQTQAANSKSELHLLQSQLSPHFLFNTLNNLYGLSLTEHEKLPPLLLKLSELLRYSVYDASDVYVPLKDELAYIRNYIDFEKIRIGDRLVLTTDIEEITDSDVRIAPMLLIMFIENAFKHSKNTASHEIFIDIQLKIWGNSILFSVKNTYGKEEQDQNILNRSSGMGLPNVSKRLELLYPGRHDLNIGQDEKFYKVELQLKMKPND